MGLDWDWIGIGWNQLEWVGFGRIRRIQSDSVGFGQFRSDLVGFVEFSRIRSDSVGFSRIWSDMVGIRSGRIRSDLSSFSLEVKYPCIICLGYFQRLGHKMTTDGGIMWGWVFCCLVVKIVCRF